MPNNEYEAAYKQNHSIRQTISQSESVEDCFTFSFSRTAALRLRYSYSR